MEGDLPIDQSFWNAGHGEYFEIREPVLLIGYRYRQTLFGQFCRLSRTLYRRVESVELSCDR